MPVYQQKAHKQLNNLINVAINTSLISDTDSTDDLGSSAKYWANGYVDKLYLNSGAPLDGAVANTVTLRYSQAGGASGGFNVINEYASDADSIIMATGYGTNVKGAFIGRSARGTELLPTASQANDELFFLGARGYGATGFVALASAAIIMKASEVFTDTAQGAYITLETTDIGAAASTRKQRIKIGSLETTVNEDGWDCDFRIEGDTAPNLFKLDASLDQIFITKTSSGALTQPFIVQNGATAASTAISQIFANTTDVASYSNGLTVLTSTRQTDGSNDLSILLSPGGAVAPAQAIGIDGSTKLATFAGVVNTTASYQVDGVQVVSNRVVDERADDVANSGDATTDGLIDALRDAMIAHGLIAAA